MRNRLLIASAASAGAAMCVLSLSNVARGQQFLPAGPITDSTTSLGQFSIVVNPAFAPAFAGNPYYNSSSNVLTSPLLYDPSTMIDRSATTTVGSSAYTAGLPVGSPVNGTVKASSISLIPTGYTPTPGEDTVFTQIHSFNLSNGSGFDVRAGAAGTGLPASVGEVTSNATGAGIGKPANDFPAKSFFDIFVDIDVPGLGSPMTNSAPLVVENPAITAFPPVVIYTHGNSSAVQLMLGSGNAFGEPAGTVFGVVTLAGHGAGYGNGSTGNTGTDENTGMPANTTDFENSYLGELATPSDLMPLPDVKVTTGPYGTYPGGTTDEESWSTYVPDVSVPEPASLALLAMGVVATSLRRRRPVSAGASA